MKKIHSLSIRLLILGLTLCLCMGFIRPALAKAGEMDSLLNQLMAVFDISQSDYDNYNRDYAASLPIVYDQKSTSRYVALGGITAGGLSVVGSANCYADKLAQSLNISYTNLADYECNATNAVAHINSNASAIAGADLITFQLDAAPFILACVESALDDLPVVWENYITDPSLLSSIRAFRDEIVSEYSSAYGEDNAKSIASLVEHLLYECVAYCFETVNATNQIRRYNSSAVILTLGLYNPLQNLVFTNSGKNLEIGNIMEQIIRFCNVFLLHHISNGANTAFIDVSAATSVGFGEISLEAQDQNDLYKELFKVVNASNKQYADKNGHLYMRDQILGALTEPCQHSSTTIKNTRPASCKEEGYTGDTVCVACNQVIKTGSNSPKTSHTYGAYTQTKAPSCTAPGEQTRTCSVCSHKDVTAVSPTGHTYGTGSVTKQPGCETTGTKTYTCADCSQTVTETIPATGHKYDAGSVTKQPGCETTGIKTYTCVGCSQTKTETVSATGHSFNEGTVIKTPGCETEGQKAVTCTVCNKQTTSIIPPTGHSWDKGTVTKAPACEAEGQKLFTCTVCSKTKTESISATGHSWNEGTVTEAPGCETEGEKALTCTVCGKSTTEVIPATGHSWNEGTETRAPGCETEGEQAVTCIACGKADTRPIPPTGHSYGSYLPNNDATCQADGTRTASCSACGATDTQADPGTRTDHKYTDGLCIYCGAEKPASSVIWWVVGSILVLGAAGGAVCFLKFKKRK